MATPTPSIETSINKKPGCFMGGETATMCEARHGEARSEVACPMTRDCMFSPDRAVSSGYSHRVNLSAMRSTMEGGRPVT